MKKSVSQRKDNRIRERLSSIRGMTMAELMVTVGVILILAAVAFIGLISYQRLMAQREADSAAREIFIAAQNHLTMARGEGYAEAGVLSKETATNDLQSAYGYPYTKDSQTGNYIISNNGQADNNKGGKMLAVMLPFGSIDDTSRVDGSFVIRYQWQTGEIKDVFYCSSSGSGKFGHDLSASECSDSGIFGLTGAENKDERRTSFNDGKAVLGWYGGDDLEEIASPLTAPKIAVENGDRLKVTVTDVETSAQTTTGSNFTPDLKLMIIGETSHDMVALALDSIIEDENGNKSYELVLDDVTAEGKHFCEITANSKNKNFIPGENIRITAVSYSKTVLANIARSEPCVTSSLYDSLSEDGTTAYISSFRHLENLDPEISGRSDGITTAKQNKDLDWDAFVISTSVEGSTHKVYTRTKSENGTEGQTQTSVGVTCYWPVSITGETGLTYDGLKHRISNVTVTDSYSGSAGLFGTLSSCNISNLELIDVSVTGSEKTNDAGNAGALAGNMSGGSVNNVVAHNSSKTEYETENSKISGAAAGGLIGSMSSTGVSFSGAAVRVSGGTSAGGLIGNSAGGSINACFSGGHTEGCEYKQNGYNVEVTNGHAGGLAGNAGSSTISNSYSTCSVSGSNGKTGGFVGESSGSISNCYCTGLVSGSGNNAFIGTGGGGIDNNKTCKYLKITNGYSNGNEGISYKGPGNNNASAIDETVESYDTFQGNHNNWKNAKSTYDSDLNKYYNGKYNLKTVTQLAGVTNDAAKYFADSHYGDWPAYDVIVKNVAN